MNIPVLMIVQGVVQVSVPTGASHNLSQSYEPIEAATLHRLSDGSAVKQSRWTKWATTISGTGATPAAFGRLDWGLAMDLWCVASMAIDSAVASIALPAARRVDLPPQGAAVVGDYLVPTPLSIVDDVATLTTVPGASGYRVTYYPILTVYAARPRQNGDSRSADYGWDLTAEEA